MREFLSAHGVPFEDRNIRASEAHRAELLARSGQLVVPQLLYGERVVVGFDPAALAEIAADALAQRAAQTAVRHAAPADGPPSGGASVASASADAGPPGNSLDPDQGARVADPRDDLATGLTALLARVREELSYNGAKQADDPHPYRLGMHDGLRFAEDAIVNLLRRHGHDAAAASRPLDA